VFLLVYTSRGQETAALAGFRADLCRLDEGLAESLGTRISRGPRPEIGMLGVRLSGQGQSDSVFRHAPLESRGRVQQSYCRRYSAFPNARNNAMSYQSRRYNHLPRE
jgi:hypothetical protein